VIDGVCFLSAVPGPHLKLRQVAGRKSSNLIQCKRVVSPKIKKALFASTLLHATRRKREAILSAQQQVVGRHIGRGFHW